jgi:hypothetical protein
MFQNLEMQEKRRAAAAAPRWDAIWEMALLYEPAAPSSTG